MTKHWIDDGKMRWRWLQLGGAALVLQQFRRDGKDPWMPAGKAGDGVSICTCEDAIAFFRAVTSRGIPAPRPEVGNRMWFASLADPDGYRLDFGSPTDEPEDTLLPAEP